jgi:hypothetical protein
MMAERKSTNQSGMAGEFFVMETLYRLGHQPALTVGNAKMIDILLDNNNGRVLKLSVKSVRGGGKWGVGTENFKKQKDLFFVFLKYNNFSDISRKPEAYIIPAIDVEKLKEGWFDKYAVYFTGENRRRKLEKYREAWGLLKS